MRAVRWLLVLAMASCGDVGFGPTIEMVTPEAAAPGEALDILGDRFCGDADGAAFADGTCASLPAGFVHLGESADVIRADAVRWEQRRITVMVPEPAPVGATLVVVTVDGVASNATPFEVR